MKIALLICLVSITIGTCAQSNDTIVLSTGIQIYGRLLSIDHDSAKLVQDESGSVFTLPVNEIKEVKRGHANPAAQGKPKNILPSLLKENVIRDSLPAYTRILKSSIISPVFGHFFISREQQLPGKEQHRSIEVCLGAIWIPDNGMDGVFSYESAVLGGYAKATYRQYYPPLNPEKNPMRKQRMMGTYYGIQLGFTAFQYRELSYHYVYPVIHYTSAYVHIFQPDIELVSGIQYAFTEHLTFSIQGGIGAGYSVVSISGDQDIDINQYRFNNWNPAFLTFSTTMTLGYRFKARKDR